MGLLGHPDLLAGFSDRDPPTQEHLDFPQPVDELPGMWCGDATKS